MSTETKRQRLTRDGPHPAIALPAIAAMLFGGAMTLAVLVARPTRAQLIERYQADADRALAAGDGQTARLCAQRLIQLDPADALNRQLLDVANALPR